MKITVDALGKQCPLPVIEAKKAVQSMTEAGEVEVLVDNEIAVQNVTKMAAHKNLDFHSEKLSADQFLVTIRVKDSVERETDENADNRKQENQTKELCHKDVRQNAQVVVLSSNEMGSGDPVLGKLLMKGYVFALTQLEQLPQTILLYNAGAYLSVEGSDALEDLKTLEAEGVEILTCGTCLNHYGITDKLAVGGITNMYAIAEKLAQADRIVRP